MTRQIKPSYTKTGLLVFIGMAALSCSNAPEKQAEHSDNQDLLLHVSSPDWRDQIIYFLMTDRFNDGDPSNNDQGAGEYNPQISNRYSGGDIQGVIDQLDYIQGMGITAVWTTPIVANQWWSDFAQYGGYHGYWATDFSDVDKHKGDLYTYQRLSDQLHRRGMYLVKDIVVNHTGNFFNYEGGSAGYNPGNTAENFILLASDDAPQQHPTQAPFDLIDRNNPTHVGANIYNWTPSITDYRNEDHQFTYQLATLADINTTNPIVIDKFKSIYADWITKGGVDAYRIDTVRYVEHDFFDQFMNDEDGILAAAQATGRDNFLAFGEVFDTSKAYENDAEKRVASYMGSDKAPILNSIISFPLHFELKTVFAQGLPTDHLAYRIQQHMTVYRDPYILPTFIDNHDMERFLASGDVAGFKQALAAIMTLPGIPTIYQGSEQAMTQSRQAMFKGGYNQDQDMFNTQSEMYQYIRTLAELRTNNKVFTRGDVNIIASEKRGAGVLAYTREYEDKKVVVLLNTSREPILVNQIDVHSGPARLTTLFGDGSGKQLDIDGKLTTELPGRAIQIMQINEIESTNIANNAVGPTISTVTSNAPITQDIVIAGTTTEPNKQILLVKNAKISKATPILSDANGNWTHTYKVNNLGEEKVSIEAYDPVIGRASDALVFTSVVKTPEFTQAINEPTNDDVGPTGTYSAPMHEQSIGQQDITDVLVETGGDVLRLTFSMRELTDDWIPPNGFDNVAFSIFFDATANKGISALPLINSTMPDTRMWDVGHVIYGWGNTTFTSEGASASKQGKRLGIAPSITVDKAAKTISFTYRADDLGIEKWQGTHIFVSTWDITGEGVYRELVDEPSDWHFGGGKKDGAKILDSLSIAL